MIAALDFVPVKITPPIRRQTTRLETYLMVNNFESIENFACAMRIGKIVPRKESCHVKLLIGRGHCIMGRAGRPAGLEVRAGNRDEKFSNECVSKNRD
jgi:hypothetical protein